jgi:hypothetical protein
LVKGRKDRPALAGGEWRELWGRPEIGEKSWIFPEVGWGPLFFYENGLEKGSSRHKKNVF